MSRSVGLGLAFALLACAPATAQALRTYTLPDAAAYPEGIALDPSGRTVYSTNVATGAVFAVDLKSGAVKQVADPFGIAPGAESRAPAISLGSKVSPAGLLWVAGGESGKMHLVDLKTGQKVAVFTTPGAPGFINDVVVTRDAAYFTDTRRPFLWRVPAGQRSDTTLEPWISFEGTALEYTTGANLNGIAATPDGRYLIVVQMAAGKLFRIDTQTRAVTRIDTGMNDITSGDGLVLDGQRLYLVRQGPGQIVALDLSKDFLTATVTARVMPKELAGAATSAIANGRLIIANSQLNKRGSNSAIRPFSLVSIPLTAFK